jgi:glycosyltransferase involved in cell wall biosynthesis
MRILLWHVHGSYTTALVQGRHEYLIPVLGDRGPDGRGRARTWDWPDSAREVTPEELRDTGVDAVVLQRVHEIDLVRSWTRREPGVDLPAVYLEHDAPPGHAATTPHPLSDQTRIPVVHVTHFNALMWDSGRAPVSVVEHGVPDPGYRYTGERASLGVVVNEPARRGRVAGTDLLLRLARDLPLDVYGMGMAALADLAVAADPGDGRTATLAGHLHDDPPQGLMHDELARHRAYLHPFRWTSLGLALIEAMLLGLPVLGLSTTAAPESVPAGAGVLSSDPAVLIRTARRWLDDPDEARERGAIGRAHALERFGMARFLDDWDAVLAAAVSTGVLR